MTAASERSRLAVLVHEVRSPTAALSAIAETVRDPGLDSSVRSDLANLAVAACRGIERIVTDAAWTSIETEPVDLVDLVRAACAAAALGGADVAVSAPPKPLIVEADPLRLRQALDNLLSNAVTHGSGPIMVALVADGDARIEVSDRGPGIPEAERERIFDRGVRLDDARPGSGLGLAVARGIVEGHGGSLSVDSIAGEGTTFVLALPGAGST